MIRLALSFCTFALLLSTPSAASIMITGNPSTDSGWVNGGYSLANGNYTRGEGTFGFNLYSVSFKLESGSGLLVDADPFSWEVGDMIVGLGGNFENKTAASVGWPLGFNPNPYNGGDGVAVNDDVSGSSRPEAKYGTIGSSFSASTTAPFQNGDGHSSLSGGDAGDGAILTRITTNRTAAGEGVLGTPDLVQRYDALGNVVTTSNSEPDFKNVARFIYDWGLGFESAPGSIVAWEYLLNLSLMERTFPYDHGIYPEPGDGAIITVQRGTNRYTDGIFDTMDMPGSPGSAATPEASAIYVWALLIGSVVLASPIRKRHPFSAATL